MRANQPIGHNVAYGVVWWVQQTMPDDANQELLGTVGAETSLEAKQTPLMSGQPTNQPATYHSAPITLHPPPLQVSSPPARCHETNAGYITPIVLLGLIYEISNYKELDKCSRGCLVANLSTTS